MNTSTLTLNPLEALYRYFRHGSRLPESNFELLDPSHSPVRTLTNGEIAMIRFEVPDLEDMPLTRHGIPYDAATRLGIWAARNQLDRMSAWQVASTFQTLYYPHAQKAQVPMRGLEVLRAVDLTSADHGITIRLRRGVRLAKYCAELSALTSR